MKLKLFLLIIFCPSIFSQGYSQIVSSLEFCTDKASLNSPTDVFMDGSDQLFIVDQNNHALRMLNTVGYINTVAGNGQPGSSSTINAASLGAPSHVAKDKNGNLYITTEYGASGIRKINPQGNITTFASGGIGTYTDGTGCSSWFTKPSGIVYDSINNFLYVSDSWAHRINRIGMDGVVKTLAGSVRGFADAASGSAALFSYPEGPK